MGGGGKSQTTTQQVSIPPEVLARYNAVNARAETVAARPFQQYGTTAESFVAPLTQSQQQGIQQTQQYAGAAQPYFNTATGQLLQAQQAGQAGTQAAYAPLMQGYQTGQQLGLGAQQYFTGAGQAALPFYQAAAGGLGAGLQYAGGLQGAALQEAMGAQGAAAPLTGFGAQAITGAPSVAALPNVAAMRMGLGAARQAQPYYGAATAGTQAALQAGQPYGSLATQAALAGSQGISPQQFSQQAIGQYMSPFMSNVVQQTMAAQAQQNAQQRAALQGEAIRAGAFGGDRAGIAQANLAYQQNLANQKTIADLLQGGYGQALGAFQQQQGVNLAAEQANRAAQQQLAQQALAIGQQGYGQQLGAAQQMAGLGQALFGQGMQGAQTLSGLGQTQFGQQLGAGQAAAQLGQQLYGQGMTGAQFLQGLGGQGFQQQLAAAQQQQQLGQGLAGLGFQTGQALQGLGAQQAQLGQTTAAQQAALAQQGYGMGAGTAQALAGLGQGAQAAGLQGAQAMLGAGQIQQQTEQAGKQALYNQFLQEQGYPFQVAQFLANIAMGTGALSGSTTTTTQPSSFFSDRKLKEDVRKVGETEDGLPIYKFRYKGEDKDQTHIGYMADEVEKKHPDAVGEYGGAKYVDYAKVNARESMGGAVHGGGLGRAAYAYGGADHIDANDLQALIRQQQQMYGPNMGGLYGGSAQQTPFGGKAAVPTGGLHVGKLATAGALPRQQQSALDQGMGAAQKAKETAEMIFGKYNPQTKQREGGVKDQFKGASESLQSFFKGDDKAAAPAATRELSELDKESLKSGLYAKGGLIPRAGYKFGGEDMYKSQQSYVPEDVLENDEKQPELMTAKGGGGGGGGGGKSGLGTALGAAGTLASFIPGVGPAIGAGMKLASAFMADGGVVPRHGYQEGGPANEEEAFRRALNRTLQFEGGYTVDTGGPTMMGISSRANPDVDLQRVKEDPEYKASIYRERYWNPIRAGSLNPRMQDVAFDTAVNLGVGRTQQLLEQAGDDPQKLLALRQQHYDRLVSQDPETYGKYAKGWANRVKALGGEGAPSGGLEGGRAQVASAEASAPAESKMGGLGDLLTSSRFWAPVGTGLLTMASSPSRYLGAAALQGLGAGLASMQPAEERAETIEQKRLQNITTALQIPQNAIFEKGGYLYVTTKDNRVLRYDEWLDAGQPEIVGGGIGSQLAHKMAERLGQKPGAAGKPADIGAPKAPSVPTPQETLADKPQMPPPGGQLQIGLTKGAASAAAAEERRLMQMPQQDREKQAEINRTIQAQALANRNAAFAMTDQLNNLAVPLAGMAAGDQIEPGMFAGALTSAANAYNYLVSQMGMPEYKVAANAVSQYELAKKAEVALSAARAAGLNMKAVSSLDELSQAIANPKMTAQAARDILATTILEKQKAAEEAIFTQKYATRGKMLPVGQDAATAFRKEYSDEMYGREYMAIKDLLSQRLPDGTPLVSYLLKKGNLNKDLAKQITPELINKKYGFDISRYFLNTVN